jgi:hypothetical protein
MSAAADKKCGNMKGMIYSTSKSVHSIFPEVLCMYKTFVIL